MARPKKTDAVVQPIIRANGEKHVLEKMFESDHDDLPEIKSVGFAKLPDGGSNAWVSYVITTKGKEVISIEVDEPNLRQIAEESAKISFVNQFIDQEF